MDFHEADKYFVDGCGRCKLVATPACKVNRWSKELLVLRRIIANFDLCEELKWKHPCYSLNGKNILLLHCFKDYCAISFFKGALLNDEFKVLVQPTENVQSGRQIRFYCMNDILQNQKVINDYINQAILIEKSGLKVEFKQTADYQIPDELYDKFNEIDGLKIAFDSLTPGRQRGYLLYFSGAKQSKTREGRIIKSVQNIFAGKGLND